MNTKAKLYHIEVRVASRPKKTWRPLRDARGPYLLNGVRAKAFLAEHDYDPNYRMTEVKS
jgi:hypothetical protein